MSPRNFVTVVNEMLKFVPEDDTLKPKLTKILGKYHYKAPEVRITSWQDVQECLIERFKEINQDELPEWSSKMLKFWKNEE
jgi:hypothetical protein